MRRLFSFILGEIGTLALGALLFAVSLILDITLGGIAPIILFALTYIFVARGVLYSAVRGILRGDFFDEKFLMSIASLGAMIIGEYAEGCAVVLFFLLGELFEGRAVRSSRNKIKALMDIAPDEATVIRDGEEAVIDADEVTVGDSVIVRSGERVPVDGVVTDGASLVDTSGMTGESRPLSLSAGDSVCSGFVVLDGYLVIRCERPAEQSSAMRVLQLVEEATERKSREESFITKFSRVYTPSVVALALLYALIPPLVGLLPWKSSVFRALSFLVISCPCALVISVPLSFFAGIGLCASRGILFKGSSCFSPVSRIKTAIFDKTGTLTMGKFSVSDIVALGDADTDEILTLAAICEYSSTHPIAEAILAKCKPDTLPTEARVIPGAGVECLYEGHRLYAGSLGFVTESTGDTVNASTDKTVVFVGRDNKILGYITLDDTVRAEARSALDMLRRLGVRRTVMLTGDKSEACTRVAEALGIDEVHSGLLPENKYSYIDAIANGTANGVMYVGDGINDTPSLARADVGVTLGIRGTDSAKESADLIIMSDNLERIPEAIRLAKKTLGIAKGNIVFAIFIKLLVLALAAFGIVNMWLSVFADVGVCVLCVLNSMRLLVGKRGQ
ncbi:MAG: cadmium-translocating P-type ATPase [Clostridia bacterium]|nr:cadmium-translocating P-type ATPase [Clostridia bacterium]